MTRLLCLLLLVSSAAVAQTGTVDYEETIRLAYDLPAEAAHLRDQFPTSQTFYKSLAFDGTTSVTRDVEEPPSALPDEESSVQVVVQRAESVTHLDLDDQTRTQQITSSGRTFLIQDEAPTYAWRLTEERAEFLGFSCIKAVTDRDGKTVEAWFTPEIPVPAGPAPYGGLPGLILILTEDDGQRTLTATDVSLGAPSPEALAPPEDGRRVTREGYREVVQSLRGGQGAGR